MHVQYAYCLSSVGLLTLHVSPMTVVPICCVGDPLQIMCTASVQFIRWHIFRVNEEGILEEATDSVLIGSSDANQMKQKAVNSVMFTFLRISPRGTSPLISMLSIDSVSIGLNGTVVHCSDVGNSTTPASTIIQTESLISVSNNLLLTIPVNFYVF